MNLIDSNFQKLPLKIYKLGLTSPEFVVLSYLFFLSSNKIVHPSLKTIAENANLSSRTVSTVIKSLVLKGLLEYDRGFAKGDKKVCNTYRIRLEKIDSRYGNDDKKENKPIEINSEFNKLIRESIEKYGN